MAYTKTDKSKLLLGVAVIALGMTPVMAMAQDAEDDEDVITVTGIRKSIEDSIAAKRNSTSIIEAISAEDIGKLPDQSIAESLARLPGLSAQRLRGRAQRLSIRGLGEDYTSALLNGREQLTTNDNRGVEFDQYPSELISQAIVYKSPDAKLVGQGLAGTVDLRTIRPLDYGSRMLAGNARYELNDQGELNAGSDDYGYRLSGTYVDQNDAGTIGWVVAAAIQTSPTQAQRFEAWGYPTTGAGNDLVLGGIKPYVESRDLERNAFLGTLEFEPTDALNITADAYYTDYKDEGVLRGIEMPLLWSSAQLQPGYTAENGLVTSGTFTGVQGVVRNDFRGRDADVTSLGLNAEYDLNELWTVEADVSHSKVDRLDTDLELYAGTGRGGGVGASDTLTFDFTGSTYVFGSTLDYSDPNLFLLTDPQGWGQAGFIKELGTEDELSALRLEARRSFADSAFTSVDFGVYFSQRDKEKNTDENFVRQTADTAPIPAELLLSGTDLGYLGLGSQVSFDPLAMLNYQLGTGFYQLEGLADAAAIASKNWTVSEDVMTVYAQANYDTEFNGFGVKGNFGLQMVETDQSSTGVSIIDVNNFGTYTDGDKYTEVLPSFNMQVDLTEDSVVRLAAAKTLARARMDQMRASQTVGNIASGVPFGTLPANTVCGFYDDANQTPFFNAAAFDPSQGRVCFGASGGNPQLRPNIATNFDISFEKYFADGAGSFVLAYFNKNLDEFFLPNNPFSDSSVIDATDIANAVFGSAFVTANSDVTVGTLSRPENISDAGFIDGFELSLNLSMEEYLPAPFDGFGFQASHAYTRSEIQPEGAPAPVPVPGLSERITNLTGYYEKNGFQARLSSRDRSEFLAELSGFGASPEYRTVNPETVIDGQIGYDFQSGPLEGASVLLQAYNLTDEEFGTFLNGDERQVKNFETYGTTYLLGVNYKF